jgi:predicted aldo/keto reductase-like oxidoreductase|tara:strand:- start:7802 stop:8632 length:831 start_codon:yes stop_codon:yes gene_type:complete
MIPKSILGKTGAKVTILGLGGEGILRTYGNEKKSYDLINRALDLKINYFESASAYSGSESYYGVAIGEKRDEIFLTSKSHARDKKGALKHLDNTLLNMKTDYLDLWQIHDVRTKSDIKEIFGPNGAIEAFIEAKEEGLVKFLGITGHQSPDILCECLNSFDFDTVLLPINPAEPQYESFMEKVIPLATDKKMGIIGMKVYLRGLVRKLPIYKGMEPFFRFALSQPITTAVIGCDNIHQLEENVIYAKLFKKMSEKEKNELINLISPYAKNLMYYKI